MTHIGTGSAAEHPYHGFLCPHQDAQIPAQWWSCLPQMVSKPLKKLPISWLKMKNVHTWLSRRHSWGAFSARLFITWIHMGHLELKLVKKKFNSLLFRIWKACQRSLRIGRRHCGLLWCCHKNIFQSQTFLSLAQISADNVNVNQAFEFGGKIGKQFQNLDVCVSKIHRIKVFKRAAANETIHQQND